MPFGFESKTLSYSQRLGYNLCVYDNDIILSFENYSKDKEDLVIVFYKEGLYSGKISSVKRETEHPEEREIEWNKPVFEQGRGILFARGLTKLPKKEEEIYFAIGSNINGIRYESNETSWFIKIPWRNATKSKLYVFVIVSESKDEVVKRVNSLGKNQEFPWKSQVKRYKKLSQRIPQVKIKGYPAASDFFRMAPLFL